jgi:hypothetical protein
MQEPKANWTFGSAVETVANESSPEGSIVKPLAVFQAHFSRSRQPQQVGLR